MYPYNQTLTVYIRIVDVIYNIVKYDIYKVCLQLVQDQQQADKLKFVCVLINQTYIEPSNDFSRSFYFVSLCMFCMHQPPCIYMFMFPLGSIAFWILNELFKLLIYTECQKKLHTCTAFFSTYFQNSSLQTFDLTFAKTNV